MYVKLKVEVRMTKSYPSLNPVRTARGTLSSFWLSGPAPPKPIGAMPRWAASSFILLPLGCFLSPDTQAFAGARRALSEKILELRLGLQVPPSVKDGLFKNDSPTNFLVIGNSGVGKSAILNCLIGDEGVLFPSGISMCEGMTKGCCPQRRDQHRFIDTPGMGDPSIPPERTADEITMALKFDGRYKVIFVLTLEHGRLDAGQLATMKLVLDAAPIKKYGVLLNQLTGPVYEKLSQKHEFERLIEIINMNMPKGKTARNPRFVQLMHEDLLLRDATNKVVNLPEEVVRFLGRPLEHFVRSLIGFLRGSHLRILFQEYYLRILFKNII